jgi:hypothetical protein
MSKPEPRTRRYSLHLTDLERDVAISVLRGEAGDLGVAARVSDKLEEARRGWNPPAKGRIAPGRKRKWRIRSQAPTS